MYPFSEGLGVLAVSLETARSLLRHIAMRSLARLFGCTPLVLQLSCQAGPTAPEAESSTHELSATNDSDGDGIVDKLDFCPLGAESVEKLGTKGEGALVYLYTGDEPFVTWAQTVGINSTIPLKASDYGVLLKPKGTETHAEEYANEVYDPTVDNFIAGIRTMVQKGYTVDIYIAAAHADDYDGSITSKGSAISEETLRQSMNRNATGCNNHLLPIRMVHSGSCFHNKLLGTWVEVGARAVSGANHVNFYPNAFNNFANDWVDGKQFQTALKKSVTDSVRSAVKVYITGIVQPGLFLSYPEEAKEACGRSVPGWLKFDEKDACTDWVLRTGFEDWLPGGNTTPEGAMDASSSMIIAGDPELKRASKPDWTPRPDAELSGVTLLDYRDHVVVRSNRAVTVRTFRFLVRVTNLSYWDALSGAHVSARSHFEATRAEIPYLKPSSLVEQEIEISLERTTANPIGTIEFSVSDGAVSVDPNPANNTRKVEITPTTTLSDPAVQGGYLWRHADGYKWTCKFDDYAPNSSKPEDQQVARTILYRRGQDGVESVLLSESHPLGEPLSLEYEGKSWLDLYNQTLGCRVEPEASLGSFPSDEDPTNNTKEKTVEFDEFELPDYSVKSFETLGGLRCSVENLGAGFPTDVVVRFLKDGNELDSKQVFWPSSQQEILVDYPLQSFDLTAHTYSCLVDPENLVPELSESNNQKSN